MSQRHIIMGLGETGFSFARFLQGQGTPFAVMDSREAPPGLDAFKKSFPDVCVYTGPFDVERLRNAHTLYMSPGVNPNSSLFRELVDEGVALKGDIGLFVEHAQAPVVGITGTNGKSTVTTWLNHMGTHSKKTLLMGGNIGIPALDLLREDTPDAYVLELSSFQLEFVRDMNLAVACITNVTDDHLDRHLSIEAYMKVKHRIYEGASRIVYNADDQMTFPEDRDDTAQAFSLSSDSNAPYGLVERDAIQHLAVRGEPFCPVDALQLKGRQNWQNALATIALAEAIGLEPAAIKAGLKSFMGLPHRCQMVRRHKGAAWVNDSKGTNVGASIAAIQGMSNAQKAEVILIAGGQGKGADFNPLAEVAKHHCKAVILFGEDADKIQVAMERHAVNSLRRTDLAEAIACASELAQDGDVVLFSPACASFDMFKNFEARGHCFEQEVMKLGPGNL